MKLSKKRLAMLAAVAERNGAWINTSWSDWPGGEQPKWVLDQFGVMRELIRL